MPFLEECYRQIQPRILKANFAPRLCGPILKRSIAVACSKWKAYLLSKTTGEASAVYRHNHTTSRPVRTEIARNGLFIKEAALEKVWPITRERVADLLADLVFVMLVLLLFVWVGLWTFVN